MQQFPEIKSTSSSHILRRESRYRSSSACPQAVLFRFPEWLGIFFREQMYLMLRNGGHAFFALALAILCWSPASAEGASVKSRGLGGACIAYAEDSFAAVDNPANAANIGRRADLGWTWYQAVKDLQITDRPPGLGLQEGHLSPKPINQWFPEFGFNLWFYPCLVFNMTLIDYDNIYTHYNQRLEDLAPSDPRTGDPIGPNAGFEYDVRELTFTGAIRWNDCHRFGASLNLYWSHTRVSGIGGLRPFSVLPDAVSDTGNSHATGLGVTIGWLGNISPSWVFGMAYSSRVCTSELMRYQGLFAEQRLDIPESWRWGVAWAGMPCWTFVGDFEYRRYSRLNGWSNSFPSSSTTSLAGTFGTKYGPGFGWQDQWIVKLGAIWELDRWTLRAGYRYERPLFPNDTTATALNVLTLNTVENYISVGGTYYAEDCSELSFFGEYGISQDLVSRYPSIAADPHTPNTPLFPGDLRFSEHSYRVGLAYGLPF